MPTPKPAVEPEWDKNLTHTTATSATHKNDGYGSNEVPASDQWNYLFNLLYQWVHWLAAQVDDSTELKVPLEGRGLNSALPADEVQISSTTAWVQHIPGLRVGDTIVGIKARVKDSVTGPTTCRVQLHSSTDGVASAALANTATSAGSGAAQTIQVTGLSIPIVSMTTYMLDFVVVSGAASVSLYDWAVLVQRQAA
jgi:hypothetical protein